VSKILITAPRLNVTIDFYHMQCFEELVDLAQATYLDRILPVTIATASIRELRGTSIADGNYLLDRGAERLILEWRVSMGQLLDRRDGVLIEPLDPDFNDLLHKSGSASYQPKIIERMSHHEFYRLSRSLAPIESDGPDDKEEWNLFEKYLAITLDDLEVLKERHSLSDMLGEWHLDQVSDKTSPHPRIFF
jgi:hypothetical protein